MEDRFNSFQALFKTHPKILNLFPKSLLSSTYFLILTHWTAISEFVLVDITGLRSYRISPVLSYSSFISYLKPVLVPITTLSPILCSVPI